MAGRLDRVVAPGRELTAEELAILNADDIARVHNEPRLRFHGAVRRAWVGWASRVAREVARASLGKERGVRVPLPASVVSTLQSTLRAVFETGRGHVVEELQRQGELRRRFAEPSGLGMGRVRRRATALVDEVERAVPGGLADQAQLLKQSGASRGAVTASLATSVAERIDRDVLRIIDNGVPFTYNEGRIYEARVRQKEIAEEVYTAMMDRNTCVNCSRFDGLRGPRATFRVPNPDCRGGSLCRCFVYYILKDERRATQEGAPESEFEALARKLPPGQTNLSDIDPELVESFSGEVLRFLAANPKLKLGGFRANVDPTFPVRVSADARGRRVVEVSKHFFADAERMRKALERRVGAKGWIAQGIEGDALLVHDLRRTLGGIRWDARKMADKWTPELQSFHLRRADQLSLMAGRGPREFYQELYSLRLANPGALDDELKRFLDVLEGRRRKLGITKPKPKPKARKNPRVSKAAKTDAPTREMPRGGEIRNGVIDFDMVHKKDRDEWFTWRGASSVEEFKREFRRITGGRIRLQFLKQPPKEKGVRTYRRTKYYKRRDAIAMGEKDLAKFDPVALNEVGAQLSTFLKETRQAYWPKDYNFVDGGTFMSGSNVEAYWWTVDRSVNFRATHYRKLTRGEIAGTVKNTRPANIVRRVSASADEQNYAHGWDPDKALRAMASGEKGNVWRGDRGSFSPPFAGSDRQSTIYHELGHARSIQASGHTHFRKGMVTSGDPAQEFQAAIFEDVKAAIEYARELGGPALPGPKGALKALVSEYGTTNLDEAYAELYCLVRWATDTGRLKELDRWLPKTMAWWRAREKEMGWV